MSKSRQLKSNKDSRLQTLTMLADLVERRQDCGETLWVVTVGGCPVEPEIDSTGKIVGAAMSSLTAVTSLTWDEAVEVQAALGVTGYVVNPLWKTLDAAIRANLRYLRHLEAEIKMLETLI